MYKIVFENGFVINHKGPLQDAVECADDNLTYDARSVSINEEGSKYSYHRDFWRNPNGRYGWDKWTDEMGDLIENNGDFINEERNTK